MGKLDMNLYLKNLKRRYHNSSRAGKKVLLDEFCQTSGFHRKHAIRLLSRKPTCKKPQETRGRKPIYDHPVLLKPLRDIWLATDQMCSTRLKAALPLWVEYYQSAHGALKPEIKAQLLCISANTIERLLKPEKVRLPKGLCGTRPGSLLKKQIPIKTDQWNEGQPGFVEADTVAHCGTTLLGNFIWSLTLTDIYSGWTENRAVWNKGAQGVIDQIHAIEETLPFTILGFDCDNGSEFLNHHLIRYFQERPVPSQFTRSRPYHKNDNAHVEQKNWTHVRQLFGYYRLEQPGLVALMNDLYQNESRLLHNFFYPSVKLIDKQRIKSKLKKKHDQPQTPYQRLMASEGISKSQKQKMTQLFKSLNPFDLKKQQEKKLRRIFAKVDLKLKGRNVSV